MSQAAAVSLLVKPAGPAGEVLAQGLRAAGLRVSVVPTVFDAVAEAQRAGGALEYLIVDVDYFGPGEFRLFPLVRREWAAVRLVACHSPGFEYKGRVAELVGADVVVCGVEEISRFIESLAPAQPAAAPPTPTSVQPPHEAAGKEAPAPPLAPVQDARVQTGEGQLASAPPSLHLLGAKSGSAPAPRASPATPARQGAGPPAAQPPPDLLKAVAKEAEALSTAAPPARVEAAPAAPPADRPAGGAVPPPRPDARARPRPPPSTGGRTGPQPVAALPAEPFDAEDTVQGEVIGTIELTEEELRLLLGEDEKA